jgi:DNA-binding NarL/FixJ family response regulator
MITIALADDYTPSRELIKKNFDRDSNFDYKLTIEAINGQDLIEQLLHTDTLPDIIFMDINMPMMDGLAATSYLTKRMQNLKIIGLSQYEGKQLALEMIHEGAKGYLTKADFPFIFHDAIKDIMNGSIYVDKAIELEPETISTYVQESSITYNAGPEITDKEKDFLHLNATELKYNDIASLLNITEDETMQIFANLIKKLNLTDRQSLAVFAIKNGYAKLAKYFS